MAQLPLGCAKGITGPKTAPTADFSATPRTGTEPLEVIFTDRSAPGTSAITSVLWNFGDTQSSTDRNPHHTYAATGTYTVSLTVTTSDGSDSDTKVDYITVANGTLPSAAFIGTPTHGPPGMTAQFTDQSTPGTSPITSWSWTFGDGGTSTLKNPSHAYPANGTYTVSLTVTTALGTDTNTKTGYITVAPGPPIAQFTGSPTSGTTPLNVAFTDQSVTGGVPITSWAWNFGDGGTATIANPNHIYIIGGNYTVSLTVTNALGSDTETKTSYIAAAQGPIPPTAQFGASPRSGTAPLTVQFADSSKQGTSPILGRTWAFGDGTTSTQASPLHTYTVPGTYEVILTISTVVGEDTEDKPNYIRVTLAPVAPTVEFTASTTNGFAPLFVQFTDQTQDGGATLTAFTWSFGDGTLNSTAKSPSHSYANPGTYTVTHTATNIVGADTLTKTDYITAVVVPVPPTAQFSGTPRSGNAPLTVNFTDLSTPGTSPITTRQWDFGDGGTSPDTNPTHLYTTPGTYTVNLLVSTAVGEDSENKAFYITANTAPTAPIVDFTASPTGGFVPLFVQFTDQSSNGGANITSYSWNFGDGTAASTLQSPSHSYTVVGTYTVTHTATNMVGTGTVTKTNYITAAVVPVPPIAQFSGTPRSGDAPLTVQFSDSSKAGTSPITAWIWDFGDGGTSTAQSPSHTYTTPGNYTVNLLVSTAVGEDTENKAFYIVVNTPPTKPIVDFTASPTGGFVPLAVQFTDQSANGGAAITSYTWRFGDGTTGTGRTASHTYTVPGTYSVTHTATNSVGTDSLTKTDLITAAVVPVPPTAQFTGTPRNGDAPLNVQFTDQSTAGTSPITTRLWDFGDGGTSALQNPAHTYTVPGTYTVTLTVSTAVGDNTNSKFAYISVTTPPVAPTVDFSASPTGGFVPLFVSFTDQSSNGGAAITAYSWNFGDGQTSTLRSPNHTYTLSGTYTVTHTATNVVGTGTLTKTDYITAAVVPVPPIAQFSGTPRSGDAPLTVQFSDSSKAGTSPITTRLWDFGDGGTSALQNPAHAYTVPGIYTVTLTVSTAVGDNTNSKFAYITVATPPVAPTVDFSASPTGGFVPLVVQFTDQSINGGAAITAYSWNFGDGGTSTLRNPTHTYAVADTYTVTHTATNVAGTGTTTKTDYIIAAVVPVAPTAQFSGTPTSGDRPLTVQFTDLSTPGTAPITARSWNFGDGFTATATNPGHTYTAAGIYTVILTVSTTAGENTASKSNYITVTNPPVVPTVDFSANPTGGFLPLTVQFTDITQNGGATVTAWSWDFGDGGTSTVQNPSHTYTVAGTYTVTHTATNVAGTGTTTKTGYITASVVPVAPVAQFSGTPLSGDAPLAVQFTDLSTSGTSPITARLWDFGDGSGSTQTNPSHNYTVPGTYSVTLTVATAVGQDGESKPFYITVTAPPVAPTVDFSATNTNGFVPLTVQFTDLSTNGGATITSWSWSFGDGGTSTAQNPSHTYIVPGVYNVTHTATNVAGTGTATKNSYVNAQIVPVAPVAQFSGTPTSGTAPLAVQFTDQSTPGTSPINARLWSFGDGFTSPAVSPSHTYTTPGTYTVILAVSTLVGEDNESKTNYITVNTPPTAPTANFSANTTSGFVPLAVQFTDQCVDGGAPIVARSWSFGDGDSSSLQNPSHTYATPGSYTVALTATNSVGPGSITRSNYISAAIVPVLPTAQFSGTPTSGFAPLTVQFTDESAIGTSPITTWAWSFGDGGTSNAQSPAHAYASPGAYSVSLKVTTAVGPDSTAKANYVNAALLPVKPTAAFSGTPTTGFAPLSVQFSDESVNGTSPITSWAWKFGDGATSTSQSPSHTYAAPGTYDVALTVASAAGVDSTARAGYVTASIVPVAPTAAFTGTPTSGDAPLTVLFTDQSTPGTSPITDWSWNFGDGGTSTLASPSHTYTTPGTYTVILTVATTVGEDTEDKASFIRVSVPPVAPTAEFSGTPTAGFAPLAVQFTDLSTNGGATITSWSWTFGDGGTSTAQSPSHTYAAPGTYTVALTATNLVGPGSTTKTGYITTAQVPVPPTAAFTGTPTIGNAPLTVQFTDASIAGTSPITGRLWDFGDGTTSTETNPSHTYTTPGTYSVSLSLASADGDDSESKPSYIAVGVTPARPTAAFSGTPLSGFAPLAVQFTDESTPGTQPISSWAWRFGDGGTSTLQSPSHTYATPGTYSVRLIAANSVGPDTTTRVDYITPLIVPVAPTAAFTGTPTSGDAPLAVTFTDQSTPGTSPITNWTWDFGDGGTSTAQSPSHTYTVPGTYTAILTVATAVGEDNESKDSYIQVLVPPTAPIVEFSGNPTAGFAPLTVQFTDQSASGGRPITSWSWSFGDGGTSTAQNPSHTYAAPDSYTVALTATNSVGSSIATKTDYIVAAIVPVAPTAAFSGTPTTGDAPLTVQFTDQSTAGTSPITSRLWDFGDGGTSAVQNPSHTYTTPGTYNVTLSVATTVGDNTDSKANYIQVLVPPVAPTVDFSGTPTTGFAPLAVQFTDLSTNGGAAITSWAWTFGDGGTSAVQNPSHSYAAPGTYTVTLTATNSVGSAGTTKTGYITAAQVPVPPTAAFAGTPTVGDAPLAVQFTDQSTAGTSPITGRSWDFGDGNTSTETNPSHTYNTAGIYNVTLTVATADGDNSASKPSYIEVHVTPARPTAAFSGTPLSGFVPLLVQFTDESTPGTQPITSWAWRFGDGGTSTLQSPSHTYATPGTYSVRLIAANSVGPDTTTRVDYITPLIVPVAPTAAFSGTPTSGDAPLAVTFTDQSTPGTSPITNWTWDFGDGGTSTAQSPSHTYTVPGTYTVILTVATAVGEDTESKDAYMQVLVPPTAPIVEFSGNPTAGFAPLTVQFTDQSASGGRTISSWSWSFGDGGTSTAQNPNHTYVLPDTYTVTLTATNSVGPASLTKTDYIGAAIVPVPPIAAFTGTPTSGDAPLTVQFTDQSTAGTSPITGRLWDFGDGGSSTVTSPSHTYATPGTYNVTLSVATAVGDNTDSKPNYIQALVPPTAPIVEFSGTPTGGFAPLTVQFTDLSADGGAAITSRSWAFGDGGTSTVQNPTHTYATPDTYTVALTATNSVGPSTTTKADYIGAAIVPVPPTAAFSGTPTTGDAPLAVQFTDQSTPGTSPITSRLWDFGDGTSSTATSPSHTYVAPGTYNVTLSVATAVGDNTDSKTNYIQALVPPTAPIVDFSGTPTAGFAPLAVQFTDLSASGGRPITSWSWSFGDGGTSTAQNPSHTYAAPDTYTVSLTATNSVGSSTTTKADYIGAAIVPVPPTAAFTGTPTSGDAPLTVQFTDASIAGTSPITARSWDFGDGATSTVTSPSHTYNTAGTYNVTLSVATAVGDNTDSKTNYIQALVPPTAPIVDFSGTPTAGFAPLPVQFTDLSANGGAAISSWSWSFGDGGTSTQQNPSHTYATPGTYNVSLTATNSVGPGSTTKTGYIVATQAPVPPTAAFSGTPASGNAPLTVQFTDASTAGTAAITDWSWDFGDGATSNLRNPSHTYTTPGSYMVILTVATADGEDREDKAAYITVLPTAPTAAFSGTPTSGLIPLTVQFTDQSASGTSPITSWDWNFGDGESSSSQNPSHAYASPGSYTVSLKVTNSVGPDSTTKAGYITATAVPPTAGFTGTPTLGAPPLTVQFTDQSVAGTSPITSRLWDFGDGNTSTETDPSHTYLILGSYTVELTVTTADGTDSETKSSYIHAALPPIANFSAFPFDGRVPLSVTFDNQSIENGAPITSWSWNFGDGGTSTSMNPTHVFAAAGTYTVSLTATNIAGSTTETKTGFITVRPLAVAPTAQFSGIPTSGYWPLPVQFTDLSDQGSAPITAWRWDFGDGDSSVVRNPSHVYANPGSYTVVLSVATDDGEDREDKTSYVVVTTAPTTPIPDFAGTPTAGFAPLTVQFTDFSASGGAAINSWSWSFGDGETATERNPSHTYASPGIYTVSLTAANSVGPDSVTKTDYITAATVPVAPIAQFSGLPTSGEAPLTVQFTDLSVAGTSPITDWLWDFGDGDSSMVQSPSHIYAGPGSYTVVLTVRTQDGEDREDKAFYITVVAPAAINPDSEFSATQRREPLLVR